MSIFSHFICELQNYTHVKTVSKEGHMTGILQKHFYIGPLMSCSSIRSKLLLRITSDDYPVKKNSVKKLLVKKLRGKKLLE